MKETCLLISLSKKYKQNIKIHDWTSFHENDCERPQKDPIQDGRDEGGT
jgi:hypothetical protein